MGKAVNHDKDDRNSNVVQTVPVMQLVYQSAGTLHESPGREANGSIVLHYDVVKLVAKVVAFMLYP